MPPRVESPQTQEQFASRRPNPTPNLTKHYYESFGELEAACEEWIGVREHAATPGYPGTAGDQVG
jgi:hypothetical protein